MNKTLSNITYFLFAVILSKILGIGTSFLTAKILEPSDYGILVTLILLASYTPILCFGTVEALIKQFPYYTGMGQTEKAREVEESVFASILLAAFLILIIGFSFHLFIPAHSLEFSLSAVRIMAAAAAVSCFSGYYYYRCTAHQNFKKVGLIDTIRAVLRFIFLIGFGWLWGLDGVLWGLFLHEFLTCIYSAFLSNKVCGKVGMNFNPVLLWEMVRIGFPITIVIWMFILQSSADRMVSMSMLGKTQTGYYGLGSSIIGMLILIPQVVSRVLYPQINEGVGKNVSKQDMAALVVTPARALTLLLPLLAGILILTAPPLYFYIFPKYLPGLVSAQILLLGSFFICMISNGTNYLIAHNRQNIILIYATASLVINIAGNILFVQYGLGINGIAISASFSGALLTTLIWKEVFHNMGYRIIDQLKQICSLYAPFIILCAVCVPLIIFVNENLKAPLYSCLATVAFTCLYLLLMATVPPFPKWIKGIYSLRRV